MNGGRSASLCAEAERGGIALSKYEPVDEDWAAVGRAMRDRMRELRIPLDLLAEETGLSPNTIRPIGKPGARCNDATLVAIAGVLEWRYNHLTNILYRKPQSSTSVTSAVEAYFKDLLHTEVGPVKTEVAVLKDIIQTIDTKIDGIIKNQRPDTDAGAGE
jgi:hypothetical protein